MSKATKIKQQLLTKTAEAIEAECSEGIYVKGSYSAEYTWILGTWSEMMAYLLVNDGLHTMPEKVKEAEEVGDCLCELMMDACWTTDLLDPSMCHEHQVLAYRSHLIHCVRKVLLDLKK